MMQQLTLLLSVLVFSLAVRAQETRIIKLKQEQLSFHPRYFYVAGVKDDRADTTTIGTMRAGALTKKLVSLNLPGGAAAAIDAFLLTNLLQDTLHTIPVVMHILQLEAAEQTGGLKAEAEMRMTMAFYIKGNKIVEYKGSNSVEARVDAMRFVEELVRRGLENVVEQFDGWMSTNVQQVREAVYGPAVAVSVVIKDTADDVDKLAWSLQRPLTPEDFQSKVDELSSAAAATFSGLDVKFTQQKLYGQTKIAVTIVPVFDRQQSWFKRDARSVKTLAHEQLHFNITAIKACELATAMRNYSFTPENYMAELQQLARQKEKETRLEQDLYDTETHHGLIVAEQQKWEAAVMEKLAGQPCYHP